MSLLSERHLRDLRERVRECVDEAIGNVVENFDYQEFDIMSKLEEKLEDRVASEIEDQLDDIIDEVIDEIF